MNFAHVGLVVAFFASACMCPWWLTVFLGVILLALFGNVPLVVIGGLLMDFIFGAPIPSLLGFSYLYAMLFLFLGALSWYLRRTLSE
ncbi:MAG: hypothetical protein V4437_00530 [Patescibacteria group bacterium]